MTKPNADHTDDPVDTLGDKARAAAGQAADQAAALAATATKEFDALKQSLERALDDAGVDTDALAQAAREKATTIERLLKEELERRPLRTLAVAVAIGALFGAIIAR